MRPILKPTISAIVTASLLGTISQPVAAQSSGKQFVGEFFTATVQNVSVSSKQGKVYITVLFRGKSFGNSHNVAIVKDNNSGCGALIGNQGESYEAKTCLASVESWYGDSGTIIKADTDTIVTFEFLADDKTAVPSSQFNFILPFQLLTCKTNEQVKKEGMNGAGDPAGCAVMTYKFSLQSMSFYGIGPTLP